MTSMCQLHFCDCLLSVYDTGAEEYDVFMDFIVDFLSCIQILFSTGKFNPK